jgi:hypothetical protein
MPLPSHHSPHFVLVQAVPVTGQRMENRCWSLALARMRFPQDSPLVLLLELLLELPWGLEEVGAVGAAEQAQEPPG